MLTRKKLLPALLAVLFLALLFLPVFEMPVESRQGLLQSRSVFEMSKRELSTRNEILPQKVDSFSWEEYDEDGMVEVLIRLKEQADTVKVARDVKRGGGYSKEILATAVVKSLQEVAEDTQAPLLAYLEAESAAGKVEGIKSFYIINVVYARVAVGLINEIASRAEVESIRPNERIELIEPIEKTVLAALSSGIAWNIERVKAPEVWASGIDGSGVVVGIIDTGVDLDHETLLHKYRGYNPGGSHVHAYNWFDPYYDDRAIPDDVDGHGTHCIGTVLGSSDSKQIGVAPGAQWIAARGLDDDGWGTGEALIACAEFLLAPTPNHDGTGIPDPTRAPDIITNSWAGDFGLDEWYLEMVNNWRNAGILPVFAAGNSGPGYATVEAPGSYPASFSVAAIGISDELAEFSSRGAAPYAHPESMQPNISAPGVDVFSATPGNEYEQWSGTSMAAPHIAGVVALLLQSDPALTVTQLENMLMNSAIPMTDDIYPVSPNYGYGYGLVDALAALSGDKTAPPVPPEPSLPPPLVDAAFAWSHYSWNPWIPQGPVTIQVPDVNTGVLQVNFDLYVVAGDFVEDTWYALAYYYDLDDDLGQYYLCTIDTVTGDYTLVGLLPEYHDEYWMEYSGLAYDAEEAVLYASAMGYWWGEEEDEEEEEGSFLFTIDVDTAETQLVGNITGSHDELFFALAFDDVGTLYGCEMTYSDDDPSYLYTINKENGKGTLIGPMGFDLWGDNQDFAFDHEAGVFYGVFYDNATDLTGIYEVDKFTGNASLLDNLDYDAGGFAIPRGKLEPCSFPGLYDPSDGVFHLQGLAPFRFGPRGSSWLPVVGDWNGNGTDSVGLYDSTGGVLHLQGLAPIRYGPRNSSWLPVAGDWIGNGTDSVGLYDSTVGVFYLQGLAPIRYGPRGSRWLPVACDWNGNGTDSVGLYDPADGVFHLRGLAPFRFGPRGSNWLPVAGDWNGSGIENVGLYDPSDGVFHLQGSAPIRYGPRSSSWRPLAGQW